MDDVRAPRHSCTNPQTGGVTARRPSGDGGGVTARRPSGDGEAEGRKGPSIETLRTRLLASKALRTALRARHERVRSTKSRAELDRSHALVADAEDALAQAVAS